jgi:hypothetical protein
MPALTPRPWEQLPSSVAAVLRPELADLADEIIDTIVVEVPGYQRPLQGGFERGLRLGVHEALRLFVELIEDPVAGRGQDLAVYRNLGRGELRQGRTLDALQSAYRIGARVAWRRWADAGTAARLDPAWLRLLAESIFVYIDELSAESVAGYAAAQAEQAGARERQVRDLFAALTAERLDKGSVREAALAAGWQLPDTLAAVAVEGTGGARVASALGADAVATVEAGVTLLLWADPRRPGARALIARALRRPAAVGPAVSWREAGRSLALARILLELEVPSETGPAPLWAADHLAALALHDPHGALAELRGARLAPFAVLGERSRARLQATLHAWLRCQGNRAATARSLGVHEQTVRYRMNQLRELLGEALGDAEARFELELALRGGAGPTARP